MPTDEMMEDGARLFRPGNLSAQIVCFSRFPFFSQSRLDFAENASTLIMLSRAFFTRKGPPIMFRFLCILFAAALVFCSGCRSTVENNDRTIQELCRYMMQQTGGTFDGEMAAEPIHADAGFALKLANRQVAFYKFNTKYKKARAKIEYVDKNKFIYIYGFKFSAISHGSFIMVDYEDNPLKEKLLEAFKSF